MTATHPGALVAAALGVMMTLGTATAQETIARRTSMALMPLPSSMTLGAGAFTVSPSGGGRSTFTYGFAQTHDARMEAAARRAMIRLGHTCGGDVFRFTIDHPSPAQPSLSISVAGPGEAVQTIDEDESYELTVTTEGATLKAANDLGAMHGLETLLQLATMEAGACVLPSVTIHDVPRFRWRGFMLDVSRHFEPVDVVEHTLDGMAAAKLNVFHWHLSDDQGFRAESKKFPKLTAVASEDEYYTQEQLRAVVAYAYARGIRVVPEFDMPGHVSSWILAYPALNPGAPLSRLPVVYGMPTAVLDPTRKSTYKFIQTLVEEMSRIFPDAYFHIGGDEVEGEKWLADGQIAAFMKAHEYAKPAQLQAYFNQQLEGILKKHNKRMIGWDEILDPALPKTIMIQSWRGEASLAAGAQQGYQGILSAPYYLDGQKTSAQMFLADPIPADTTLTLEQQKLILGGEVCMWAEQVNSETVDSRVWPRTMAIAERLWSPQEDRDTADMYRRLRVEALRLESLGLRHISGPAAMRRNLLMAREPEALDVLASVLEPVDFHERSGLQHTNGWTGLDRLVDAVAPDPPSRQQVAGEVAALIGAATPSVAVAKVDASGEVPQGRLPSAELASERLHERFVAWQAAETRLLRDVQRTPRLSDAQVRVEQLGELAGVGLASLAYLESHTVPPPGWMELQLGVLDRAQQPGGLVRFTILPSLRRLVLTAAQAKSEGTENRGGLPDAR